MKSSLTKYKIGLGLIGLFTVVILIVILVQASSVRQDQQTEKAANDIAGKLNNYENSSSSGYAPNSLSQAGVTDVPSTITYTKTGLYSYEFCMIYNQASSNFDPSSVAQNTVTSGLSAASSGYGSYQNEQSYYTNLPDLEIDPIHHKGKNCQTVQLYGANYTNTNTNTQ